MNPRDRLQLVYEIAFYPPRLHEIWNKIKRDEIEDVDETIDLLVTALSLHQALPESGFPSHRALKRLALYQVNSRAFGTVTFLRNILKHLSVEIDFPVGYVPPNLIRDIGLPEFCRPRNSKGHKQGLIFISEGS